MSGWGRCSRCGSDPVLTQTLTGLCRECLVRSAVASAVAEKIAAAAQGQAAEKKRLYDRTPKENRPTREMLWMQAQALDGFAAFIRGKDWVEE